MTEQPDGSVTAAAGTNSLVAVQFDRAARAQELFVAAQQARWDSDLVLRDAVFVTGDADGMVFVTETTDVSAGLGVVHGAFWGGLVGLLVAAPIAGIAIGAGLAGVTANLIDYGISNEFIDAMRERVQPGKTVLVLLLADIEPGDASEVLARLTDGEILSAALTEEALIELRDAISNG